jgi:hypothetical protein
MPEAEGTAPAAAPATPAPAPTATTPPAPSAALAAPAPAPAAAAPAAEGAAPAPAPTPATPAAVEYTLEAPKDLPEGLALDADGIANLNEFAKTHKLPKETAEAVLALAIERAKAQQEALVKTSAAWKDEVLKDPVLGKPEAVAAVRKVVSTFGDESLVQLLDSTGMANHPTVVRFVHKLSQALSEDAFIPSNDRGPAGAKPRDPAAVLYGGNN